MSPVGSSSTAPKRVLACDDEPAVTRLLERFLGFSGFEVTTVSVAWEVIPTLSEGHYDVVLLDLMMPGMTGTEILREMRARDDELADLPVIVLTAKVLEPEERAAQQRLGAPLSHSLAALRSALLPKLSQVAHHPTGGVTQRGPTWRRPSTQAGPAGRALL